MIYADVMPTRRDSTRTYSRQVEPPEVVSALTPAGMIQSYGNIFAATRSARGWRRVAAIAITSLMCLPLLIIAIGFVLMIIGVIF